MLHANQSSKDVALCKAYFKIREAHLRNLFSMDASTTVALDVGAVTIIINIINVVVYIDIDIYVNKTVFSIGSRRLDTISGRLL
jgi:hypothetical protein